MPRFFGPNASGFFWVHDLIWLLIVVAVVVSTFFVVRALVSRPSAARQLYAPPPAWTPQNPALHELDLRYARGEIERDEYMQRRADLSGQAPPAGPGPTPG